MLVILFTTQHEDTPITFSIHSYAHMGDIDTNIVLIIMVISETKFNNNKIKNIQERETGPL